MTVNLTRIYTKLGDAGETHLGDMSRVSKLHPRVEAYGTVDELNAVLGVALLQPGLPANVAAWLARVQNDLLDLGADLSVHAARGEPTRRANGAASRRVHRVAGAGVRRGQRQAAPLHSFVIPGGTPAAAQLHVCRTVCRRAERRALAVRGRATPRWCATSTGSRTCCSSSPARSTSADGRSEPLWDPGAHGGRLPASCRRAGSAQRRERQRHSPASR